MQMFPLNSVKRITGILRKSHPARFTKITFAFVYLRLFAVKKIVILFTLITHRKYFVSPRPY